MAKINVLPKNVAELIAAGEVVDRPSAVIKELVENSIDSGADAITVEIKNGGRTFMRVTDNGCGISKEDIPTAFLRHATSKIKTGSDLDAIYTLGFRGEALASICAVSRVSLITRTPDNEFGYAYEIEGGEEVSFEEAGCALGTTFIVKDLFFNTPARMKFLKKDNTESNVVVGIIERIALSHPEISFKLIKDGKQVINTPGDGLLKSACFSIFGAEFSNSLLPVEYELDGIKVSGFVTKPTNAKKNRTMQFFFLNGRYIRTKTGIAALEQAYKNRIMTGMFPGCVLNVNLEASMVDVNVHPSKIEVRFSNEQSVFRGVYYAVMSALDADVSRVAFKSNVDELVERENVEQIKFSMPEKSVAEKKEDFFRKTTAEEFRREYAEKPKKNEFVPDVKYEEKPQIKITEKPPVSTFDIPYSAQNKVAENTVEYNKPQKKEPVIAVSEQKAEPEKVIEEKQEEHITFKYIGEAFDTYILVECDDKMIMIDKHAAHERIIFERLRENAEHTPQMLLIPVQVELSADEYEAIVSNIDEINALGFEIEDYGMKTVLVRSIPMELDKENVKELIEEIAGKLNDKFTDFSPEFLDWLYHSVACRAAIKGGNKSSATELSALADIVLNDKRIRYCPHGRPVTAEMSLYEFKKRFSRIV